MSEEAKRVAEFARRVLRLASVSLPENYYYQSLTLCVINAVFSINSRYKATQNVVERYCSYYGLKRVRDNWCDVPPVERQESISTLCGKYDRVGSRTFADDIYQNRQRTSPRGGILKADAVGQFAAVLRDHSIECLQDVSRSAENHGLEAALRAIPGQRSGISARYLWMLGGSEDVIKPDRWILRFLRRALDREVALREAQDLLAGAAALLRRDFPHLTPRLLDHAIWNYETAQARGGA
jgi:hypothetical protein